MNALIAIVVGLISSSHAFASSSIEWTTQTVPLEVRERVDQKVRAECVVFGDKLKETSSSETYEVIDNGVVDYFYSITLSTTQASEGKPSAEAPAVQAEVAYYSFSNPGAGDPISVKVQGLEAGFCK